jgi:hypothetical protein
MTESAATTLLLINEEEEEPPAVEEEVVEGTEEKQAEAAEWLVNLQAEKTMYATLSIIKKIHVMLALTLNLIHRNEATINSLLSNNNRA